MCLPACLKSPPRFDLKIQPGRQCTFAATFDKTAAGVRFGNVESSDDRIIVPADFDLATVEVDLERLTAATGLSGVEETEKVWASVVQLVQNTVPGQHASVRGAREGFQLPRLNVSSISLLDRICTAAHSVQLFAYESQLRKFEAQLEGALDSASSEQCIGIEDQVKKAKDNLNRASSAANVSEIQTLATWYLQTLFGDKGRKNLYSYRQRCAASGNHIAPHLMGDLEKAFNEIRGTSGLYEEAYRDRLRFYSCFYDREIGFWLRCWDHRTVEEKELIQWRLDLATLPTFLRDIGMSGMHYLGFKRFVEARKLETDTNTDEVWIGRHIRTMLRLFGDVVLYFMGSHVEAE